MISKWPSIFRNPVILFALFFAILTGMMLWDFLSRTGPVFDIFGNDALAFILANAHWVVTITAPTAYFYATAFSTAFAAPIQPAFGTKLMVSGVLFFSATLHIHFILPDQNGKVERLRAMARGKEVFDDRKSSRAQSLFELFQSLAEAKSNLMEYESQIERDSINLNDRKKRVSNLYKEIAELKWEISKKIQLPTYFPIFFLVATGVGVLFSKVSNRWLRLILVYFASKLALAGVYPPLVLIGKQMARGEMTLVFGWLHYSVLVLAAFLCLIFIRSRFKAIANVGMNS